MFARYFEIFIVEAAQSNARLFATLLTMILCGPTVDFLSSESHFWPKLLDYIT